MPSSPTGCVEADRGSSNQTGARDVEAEQVRDVEGEQVGDVQSDWARGGGRPGVRDVEAERIHGVERELVCDVESARGREMAPVPAQRKEPLRGAFVALNPQGFFVRKFGGDLLSHTVTSAVPSAQKGLTTGFGMGPGVSPTL